MQNRTLGVGPIERKLNQQAICKWKSTQIKLHFRVESNLQRAKPPPHNDSNSNNLKGQTAMDVISHESHWPVAMLQEGGHGLTLF